MKIVGIITEYNPFHNGHIYHINKTLELSKADLLVCVMSGNYCMRGDLAVASKISRAEVAMMHKVDCVLELPLPYSLNSADMFAYGAVKTLANFGVNEIYFGSESNDLVMLEKIATLENDLAFNTLVKENMKKGYAYPRSYALAVEKQLNVTYSSNDLLGVKYLSALKKINSKIKPSTIKRIHANYQDTSAKHPSIASATAIRKMSNKSAYVPKEMLERLNNKSLSDYYSTIQNILLTRDNSNIFLVSEGIDKYLQKNALIPTYDAFINQVVNKRYSRTRIKRTLINILLNNTKKDMQELSLMDLDYFRILKMDDKAKNYLNNFKNNSQVKVISNYKSLPDKVKKLTFKADKLYDQAAFQEELQDIPYWKKTL